MPSRFCHPCRSQPLALFFSSRSLRARSTSQDLSVCRKRAKGGARRGARGEVKNVWREKRSRRPFLFSSRKSTSRNRLFPNVAQVQPQTHLREASCAATRCCYCFFEGLWFANREIGSESVRWKLVILASAIVVSSMPPSFIFANSRSRGPLLLSFLFSLSPFSPWRSGLSPRSPSEQRRRKRPLTTPSRSRRPRRRSPGAPSARSG